MKVGNLIQYQSGYLAGPLYLVVAVMPENDNELRCKLLADEGCFDIIVPVNDPYRWLKVWSEGSL